MTDLEIVEATPKAKWILAQILSVDRLAISARTAIIEQQEVGLAQALSAYVLTRAQKLDESTLLTEPLKKALLEQLIDTTIAWNTDTAPRYSPSNVLKIALQGEAYAKCFRGLAACYYRPGPYNVKAVRDMDRLMSAAKASAGEVLEALNGGPCSPGLVDSWEVNVALEQMRSINWLADVKALQMLKAALENENLCKYLGRVRSAISSRGRALTSEEIETTLALVNKSGDEPRYSLNSIIRAANNVRSDPGGKQALRRVVVIKAIEACIPAFPTERWLIERGLRNYLEGGQGAAQLHALLMSQHNRLRTRVDLNYYIDQADLTLEVVAEAYGLGRDVTNTILEEVREGRSVESRILGALSDDPALSSSLHNFAATIAAVPAEQALTPLGVEAKELLSTLVQRTDASPLEVLWFAIDDARSAELIIRSFLTQEQINALQRDIGGADSGAAFLEAMQQTGANVAGLLTVALGRSDDALVNAWNEGAHAAFRDRKSKQVTGL